MNAEFFTQIRAKERNQIRQKQSQNGSPALLGTDTLPDQECLRFTAHHDLAFPTSSVEEQIPLQQTELVLTNLLHIAGAEGVLPLHYSKLVISRLKQKDRALADFLDMFHHRLTSLFYRAWCKYRLAPQYEAHKIVNEVDPISRLIDALSGNHTQTSNLTRYYSGHFTKRCRSAANLEAILTDFLQTPVKVEQFIGNWLQVPEKGLSKLAGRVSKGDRLGFGIFIGRRSWSAQSNICVHINEVSATKYERIKAGSEQFRHVKNLIDSFAPSHISVEIKFHINNKTSMTKLSTKPQLSRNTWLTTCDKTPLTATTKLNGRNHNAI